MTDDQKNWTVCPLQTEITSRYDEASEFSSCFLFSGTSPLRPMWRSLRRSRPLPQLTCVMPSAGSTTSSPTRTRRTGVCWCVLVCVGVCSFSEVSPASSCHQSSRCEEASGSVRPRRCGRHHLWLCVKGRGRGRRHRPVRV